MLNNLIGRASAAVRAFRNSTGDIEAVRGRMHDLLGEARSAYDNVNDEANAIEIEMAQLSQRRDALDEQGDEAQSVVISLERMLGLN